MLRYFGFITLVTMWCLKIWLAVIVVFVTFTSINTSQKLDMKRHGNERVKYSCKQSNTCKNGGTCIPYRRQGWFRKCICPEGWTGRRCNVKYGCKHSNMCKNGGTCIPYRRHGWFRKCICPDGWTGRRCNVPIPNAECKNRRFCKNGGTLVCSGRSKRSWKCICTDDWSGRRCDEYIGKEEYQEFVSFILRDPQMQQYPPYIFMTTDTQTDVKITTIETSENQMTSFNSSITIPYPAFGTNVSSELKAIRIRSRENITVAVSAHQDITTLIPTEKLSTSYIFSTPIRDSAFQAYIAITVTAIHDNTSITFSDLGDSTSAEYTLNALETRIQDYRGTDPRAYNVQSSKPVAVFCAMYCMSDVKCTNMIEQIPPSSQLDTVYIIPPNINMLTAVLIVPQKNTTLFDHNDGYPVVTGNIYDAIMLNNVLVRRSTDPILVTAYALNEDLSVGGPYWTVVPGVNQYLPRYKVIIQNGWNANHIAIMIRKSAVGGLRVKEQSIDANAIRFEKNVFVEDLEYSVIIAEVAEGELTVDTVDETPFGLMVYGNRAAAGYGFAGNVVLR